MNKTAIAVATMVAFIVLIGAWIWYVQGADIGGANILSEMPQLATQEQQAKVVQTATAPKKDSSSGTEADTSTIVTLAEIGISLGVLSEWKCTTSRSHVDHPTWIQLRCMSIDSAGDPHLVLNNAPVEHGVQFVLTGSMDAYANARVLQQSVFTSKISSDTGYIEYRYMTPSAESSFQMLVFFGPGKAYKDGNDAQRIGDAIAQSITWLDGPCPSEPAVVCPAGSIPQYKSDSNSCSKPLGCGRLVR